jgi:hypothetical protein
MWWEPHSFSSYIYFTSSRERERETDRQIDRKRKETTDRSHSYLSTSNQWLFNKVYSYILEKARTIEWDEEFYLFLHLIIKDNNVDKRHWRETDYFLSSIIFLIQFSVLSMITYYINILTMIFRILNTVVLANLLNYHYYIELIIENIKLSEQ